MNIKCKACGITYPSGFYFGNAKNVTMKDNMASCPRCGQLNGLPDGVFDFEDGAPTLVRALSNLPQSSLGELKSLIEKTQEKNLGFEEFQREATMISPEILDFIPHASRTNAGFLFFLTLLLTIILQFLPAPQVKFSDNVSFITKKETANTERKQKRQKAIEKESSQLIQSKKEANAARRKFLENKKKSTPKD